MEYKESIIGIGNNTINDVNNLVNQLYQKFCSHRSQIVRQNMINDVRSKMNILKEKEQNISISKDNSMMNKDTKIDKIPDIGNSISLDKMRYTSIENI